MVSVKLDLEFNARPASRTNAAPRPATLDSSQHDNIIGSRPIECGPYITRA